MPPTARFVLGPLAALLMLVTLARGQQVDLSPKFEKGQETRFQMETSSTSSSTVGKNAAEKNTMKMEVRFALRVKDTNPETGATVDLVYERVKVAATMGTDTVEFDSDKPASRDAGDEIGPLMRPLVGMTLTLTIDPLGNITSVSGGGELSALSPGASLGRAAGVKQLIGPIFSPKKSPGKVSVGQTWENVDTLDTGMMGAFRMITKHTLRSITDGDARVSFTGTIEPSSEAPGVGGMEIKNSRYDGEYVWDTERGMLDGMTTKMSLRLGGDIAGTAVSTTSEGETKITRLGR
ncbi:MAG: hypothetical protein IT437_03855 [Phycisphaerales bacterium]|nr:hypothetical protein [Phycisphaerales bacterium]